MTWRAVDGGAPPEAERPAGRERHSLTALSGGRLLLFGGTDGTTTLGDAWWLDLEDVPTSPPPPLISPADLPPSAAKDQAPAPVEAPGSGGSPGASPLQAPAGPAGVTALAAAAPGQAGGLGGGLSYLSATLPAMPPSLSSAFESLRGRLGLPPAASSGALAAVQAQAAAAAASAEHNEALLRLGERVLAAAGGGGGGGSGGGVPLDAAALAAAARRHLAGCAPDDLRLGELPVLMADYRRLARVGWAMVLRERGVEGLLDPAATQPGRFMHLAPGELRVKEVEEVLADYRQLLAAQGGDGSSGGSSSSGAA